MTTTTVSTRTALVLPQDVIWAGTPSLPAEWYGEHQTRFGPMPERDVLAAAAAAGLTGHGGAHVPVAAKWRRIQQRSGDLTVVGNGAEGEPFSAKDATLLQLRPHLVLDGLELTARALGASRAVLWLHSAQTHAVVTRAAAQRPPSGPRLEVVMAPAHYLAGESSAIARALAGGPTLPMMRRPGQQAPRTLVHNVETLARLALLVRDLPGTDTRLLTVVHDGFRRVLEVPRGTPLREVLPETSVLVGGFGGSWVPWWRVSDAVVEVGDLDIGPGILAPLLPGACPVAETAAIADYLARASARQCGPCRFGLPAVADSLRQLRDGERPGSLREDLAAIRGRGACHHPDGAVRLVASLLEVFAEHVREHLAGRSCAGTRRWEMP